MAKSVNNSHVCGYCDAEYDLIPGNSYAYIEPSFCPYCGGNLEENDSSIEEDIVDWDDE